MAKAISGKVYAGVGLGVALISFILNWTRSSKSMTIFGIVGIVFLLYGLFRIIQERGTAASVKKEKHHAVHHPRPHHPPAHKPYVRHAPVKPAVHKPHHTHTTPPAHHEGTFCPHCRAYTKDKHGICFRCGKQKQ